MSAAPVFQLHPEQGPAPVEAADVTEVFPNPSQPLKVARALLDERTEDGHLLLRRWRDEWWQYQGPHWTESENAAVRKWIYTRLEDAVFLAEAKGEDEPVEKPWSPDKGKVDKVLDAMVAPTLLGKATEAPTWLSTGRSAAGLVPCLNGLVDVTTGDLRPLTPDYFGTVAIPFDYDADAPAPAEWLTFLRALWPPVPVECDPATCTRFPGTCQGLHDADELDTLQEWFGYVLSGRLDLQKILLLIGPPRSGKSTIGRILTELVGKANTASPTLASMATNFGLQPLLGKSLAIVGDARLQAQGQEAVVERLLSISGEDSLTVDRKNQTAWIGTIPARIMLISNELPKFGDASGAIASRFVILKMTESFLGKEDIGLEDRLRRELPAILRWALAGLQRLNGQRRLTEPVRSQEAVRQLADLVSPIKEFIREALVTDNPLAAVPFSTVYREYQEWCRENHRGVKSTAAFSSDLTTALPEIKTDYRPKVDGRKGPRHVKGVAISPEWTTRVRDDADDPFARSQRRRDGYDDSWHRREPPADSPF